MRGLRGMFVASALLAVVLRAGAAEEKKPAGRAAGKAVLIAPDDMKWIDAPNSPPGVKMAVVSGDPAKGPHRVFHKLPAGFDAPLHFHTPDHSAVVIAGTVVMRPEGGEEKKLPPGSYFSFTGKKKHTTKCEAGADCIIYGDAKATWDVVMDEKKAEKK